MKLEKSFFLGLGMGVGLGMVLGSRRLIEMRDTVAERATDAFGEVKNAVRKKTSEVLEPIVATTSEIKDKVKDAVSSGKVPGVGEVIQTAKDAFEGTVAWKEETRNVEKLAS